MIEQRPLNGIRVLDLSRVLAGPFCSMNLGDMGAEVIKIELPGRGDDSRGFPPMLPGTTDSGYFYSVNRGKLSVTLDLRVAEGPEILLDLVRHSDIVLENFAPGTMGRFGLDYPTLAAANRGIILCSISGFGQTGPMMAAPAYDIVAQAVGGTMSITGTPGGAPLRCGVSIGDITAALYAVIAIMAALRIRDATGAGQHLDIAMLDCQVAILEDALARYSASGRIPGPLGTRHPSITPFQQFQAADGYFVVGAGNESLWQSLCDAIGLGELKEDARFKTNAMRTANHSVLEEILSEHFGRQPRDYWLHRISEAGVPVAPVNNLEEVSRNSHLAARNMILNADHPSFSGLMVPGSPLKSTGSDATPNTRAPQLGEHTDQVLGRLLGYDPDRLSKLHARGII